MATQATHLLFTINPYFGEKSGPLLNFAGSVGIDAMLFGISAVLLLHPSDAAAINNIISLSLNTTTVPSSSPVPYSPRCGYRS